MQTAISFPVQANITKFSMLEMLSQMIFKVLMMFSNFLQLPSVDRGPQMGSYYVRAHKNTFIFYPNVTCNKTSVTLS